MIRPGRALLKGIVEANETYVGGQAEGTRGRGAFGKRIVLVVAERDGRRVGRIRLQEIPNVQLPTLEASVSGLVESGSTVVTDGWRGYNFLSEKGYLRIIEAENDSEMSDIVLPKCHSVISLLKRWMLGTLQGSVGAEHLQDYLNEFTFRFNRRTSRSRGLLFQRLLEMCVQTAPNPRQTIVPHNS